MSRGFASWAAKAGADGPMSEYSSRDMLSGFLVDAATGFGRGWDGPGVEDGPGIERMLRTSAALADMAIFDKNG